MFRHVGLRIRATSGSATCGGTTASAGTLPVGTWLETHADAVAAVKVANIGELTVFGDSKLRVVATNAATQHLELARGHVHARVSAPPRLFIVDTPAATAVDLGCQYDLTVDSRGTTHLRVTVGAVSLEDQRGAVYVPATFDVDMKPGELGTPISIRASNELRDAVSYFDGGGPVAPRSLPPALAIGSRCGTRSLAAPAPIVPPSSPSSKSSRPCPTPRSTPRSSPATPTPWTSGSTSSSTVAILPTTNATEARGGAADPKSERAVGARAGCVSGVANARGATDARPRNTGRNRRRDVEAVQRHKPRRARLRASGRSTQSPGSPGRISETRSRAGAVLRSASVATRARDDRHAADRATDRAASGHRQNARRATSPRPASAEPPTVSSADEILVVEPQHAAEEVVAAVAERIELDRHTRRCPSRSSSVFGDCSAARRRRRGCRGAGTPRTPRRASRAADLSNVASNTSAESLQAAAPARLQIDVGADAAGRLLEAVAQRQPVEPLRELEREADLVLDHALADPVVRIDRRIERQRDVGVVAARALLELDQIVLVRAACAARP